MHVLCFMIIKNCFDVATSFCVLLTQSCRWYHPPDIQGSVTVPSQWLRHMRGTALEVLAEVHTEQTDRQQI